MTERNDLADLPDPYPVEPLTAPPDATLLLPGSKSITNRALVCAALAGGTSTLDGILFADDTEAMLGVLREVGVGLNLNRLALTTGIDGCAGQPAASASPIDVRQSGTTARFVLPLLALGSTPYHVVADGPMARRPMSETLQAIEALGGELGGSRAGDRLPATVKGPLQGGRVEVRGDASSQFLSGLLLAAPCMPNGLAVHVTSKLVSRPYVDMTLAVMRSFGASVDRPDEATFFIAPTGYRPTSYVIEPDASTAAYFFAAAAICGGRVRVPHLGRASLQGDVGFVHLLARMGAHVRQGDDETEVVGTGALAGIDADLADMSDTAQTLAVTAAFAAGPTKITGIGFIRNKETDRIAAVGSELRRCGIGADVEADGWRITPRQVEPAAIRTYQDHRMAMSFALLGLRAPGISIADPACVAKTFPGFWATLDELRRGERARTV